MAQTSEFARNAYNQGIASAQQAGNVQTAPTIASAVGKIDGINERLDNILKGLQNICDAIGGPRGAGVAGKADTPPPAGVVGRLHESTFAANEKLTEIEQITSDINRLLG